MNILIGTKRRGMNPCIWDGTIWQIIRQYIWCIFLTLNDIVIRTGPPSCTTIAIYRSGSNLVLTKEPCIPSNDPIGIDCSSLTNRTGRIWCGIDLPF